jgi:hypothetical protein
MIQFFRNTRQKLAADNNTKKYLRYAIGEIILVVIGILIALQINNWNEDKKARATELYVLQEILNNLNEDAVILNDIILHRTQAKFAIANMQNYLNHQTIDKDTLERDLVNFLTFERYFPINHAYEVLKSKGLRLTNNALTTKISRYYDYEQKKMNSSIVDIEVAMLRIFTDATSILPFITSLSLNEKVTIADVNDPEFKRKLYRELVAFKDNNGGTLSKLLQFHEINISLRDAIQSELNQLQNKSND